MSAVAYIELFRKLLGQLITQTGSDDELSDTEVDSSASDDD
jgi:hypothetical protein